MQQIPIVNPSDQAWVIFPVLQGQAWKVAPEVTVPAHGQAIVEVTYKPFETTREQPHEGSLFISHPDGSAKLFRLRGIAEPPESSGRIETSFTAKSTARASVRLVNWLSTPQIFDTAVEYTDRPSELSQVILAQSIQLPALGSRDVALHLEAYHEGVLNATVTFTNRESGEYIFYTLHADVTEPQILDTFRLEAAVRQVASQAVVIENPLHSSAPVEFEGKWWECSNPFIRALVTQPMTGKKEGVIQIEYRPLIAHNASQEAEIVISNRALGRYRYILELQAIEATTAQVIRFDSMLGLSQHQTLAVRVFNAAPTQYTCQLEDQGSFSIQNMFQSPAVTNWDGAVIEVPVEFEPTALGEHVTRLVVRSKDWGMYRFELVGTCRPPIPQGPFVLSVGGTATIPFKNIFMESQAYRFVTDDPRFVVTPDKQTVAAKASVTATVKYNGAASVVSETAAVANLRIIAEGKNCAWSYYLRGTSST